jgi:hypothetical protein
MTLKFHETPPGYENREEAHTDGWVDSYSDAGGPREWRKYEKQGYCGLAGKP